MIATITFNPAIDILYKLDINILKEDIMKKEELSVEELMKRLEEVTNKLEKEELNLDESITLFEEGMKLSKKCNETLENAEKRITILLENNGELIENDFVSED